MTRNLSGRALKVLRRFPRHMQADAPGKLIGRVTDALVRDQDVQAADMQGIRLAHRLFGARELYDLLLLADLHGIRRSEMAVLFARHDKALRILAALKNGDDEPAVQHQLSLDLLALWALPGDEPLKLFAVDPAGTEPLTEDAANAAIKRLLPEVSAACRTKILLESIRHRIAETAAIHIIGNGSVRALLRGAANALDLDLGKIEHSEDRFWHAAPVHDRLRLKQPALTEADISTEIPPRTEYMGIEENPKIIAEHGPRACKHAELFHVLRKGFEAALLEIRITGTGDRTISPMVVNRDSGHGLGIFAKVPDGTELIFSPQGRALLDGRDVTSRAYAWQGACFAASGAERLVKGSNDSNKSNDFVFADAEADTSAEETDRRTSRFVVVSPAGTLDRKARLPHAGESLPMPTIGVGKTRFAFFVQHGHFSALLADKAPASEAIFGSDIFASTPAQALEAMELLTPRHGVGFADAAVFADPAGAADKESGSLHLRWMERQAYTVKLLIPKRFRHLNEDGEDTVESMVTNSIRRFRPAGVNVKVDFVEEGWLLGMAELPTGDEAAISPISGIRSHTLLEPVPEVE